MSAERPLLAASALVLFTLAAIGCPKGTVASGFSLPELSAAGIGTANALVANPQEPGAFAYNPAAMGLHEGSSLALGAVFIAPSFSLTNSAGRFDSQGADWYAGPLFQAALRLSDQWRIGLGVNAPFGLETRWAYGTFPALSQSVRIPGSAAPVAPVPPPPPPAAGAAPARASIPSASILNPAGPMTIPTGNHPTTSKLEILDFVPSAAYRVNQNLSLGFGLDIYWAKSAKLNSNLGELRGDGSGIGFNLGAQYRLHPLSLGIAYRSGATLDIDGSYQPLSLPLVLSRRLAPGQGASVDLDLPWRLQLGVRYAFTPELAAELDWTRTGWGDFDRLEVKGTSTGTLIFSDVNDWEDSNAYRLGLTYQVRPDTQLRLGYSFDQTGQGDDHFSARVPDADRQLFGIGIAHRLTQDLALEAGFMYVMMDERRVRSATPYGPDGGVNGTLALNGDYEMDAHVLGIELVKSF